MRHAYLHLHVSVTRMINEPNLGTCYKGSALSDVGEFWIGQYMDRTVFGKDSIWIGQYMDRTVFG